MLKDQVPGVKTAFYYNWAELINSFNKAYLDEVNFEENDGYAVNYGKAYDFLVENEDDPTLIFLYTVHVDHAGHSYKWMSPEYIKAIEDADAEIGKLIDKMKGSGHYDDTNFLLISDHGGNPASGHGGLSIEEMQVPWGITGPGIVKNREDGRAEQQCQHGCGDCVNLWLQRSSCLDDWQGSGVDL